MVGNHDIPFTLYLQTMKTPHNPVWVHKVWENPPDPMLYFFPGLADVDFRKIETKLLVLSVAFFVFLLIFILSYFVSLAFETFRSKLRAKEKVFWCLAFVRSIFGLFSIFPGLWFIGVDDTLKRDVVNGSTPTSFLVLNIANGFFVFECFALYLSSAVFRNFDPFLFTHHTLSLAGVTSVVYYENTHFFAMTGMLLEMTTPFSCFCWMLLKAGMANHISWKVNQLVLVHLFHCRTTIEGYAIYMLFMQWENVRQNMPLLLFWILIIQLTVQFFLLTPYWAYKKMNQLFNPVDWNHPELQKQQSDGQNTQNVSTPNDNVTVSDSSVKKRRKPKKNK